MQFSFHNFYSSSVYSELKDASGLVISWALFGAVRAPIVARKPWVEDFDIDCDVYAIVAFFASESLTLA